MLKKKKPDVVFLENVKRLKSHDKGKTLKVIKSSLKEIGYHNIHIDILKARDFGLPQNRERIFIIGFKDNDIKFSFPKPTNKNNNHNYKKRKQMLPILS